MLLLDDKTGTTAAAGTLPYSLDGAVLAELALIGRGRNREAFRVERPRTRRHRRRPAARPAASGHVRPDRREEPGARPVPQ
ncbi:hypothetical protein [Amycolatopsis sp. WAC 04169]|uniref:hypothetical protein n=1 Tax=Amycolatopsis sp. WAC 04169 TaxID=2203197 RepID=UPI001F36BEA2|nr:hypothetical protein [Amycolatopsis sp. WAC 04169]